MKVDCLDTEITTTLGRRGTVAFLDTEGKRANDTVIATRASTWAILAMQHHWS
jgi:hypothetical protein